ncbi:MAG: TonB-dependent receptor, partial [Bacteroidales bacterium]|nr:TonB-dependent receptor [Bacteroidales bacterium]
MTKIGYIVAGLMVVFSVEFSSGMPAIEKVVIDEGDVKGEVHESGKDIPVEYANIILFRSSDSSMVTGGISGNDGTFHLKKVPYGNYYMTIDFIGFKKKTISDIVVSKSNKHIDLGKLLLNMTAVDLQGAEITADKMAVEYQLDRKVINVDQNLGSAGNSAVEVLERAPSIRVDITGEVQLRGSSNFTVLIDGKPSILDGSEALQQIPASTIESIEIITNPSVKYDPDGTSGIINIKLKKNKLEGLSGVATASAATGDKYKSDLYLNYKTGKFNILGGVEWNDRRFPGEMKERRETYGDTTLYKNSTGDGAWLR